MPDLSSIEAAKITADATKAAAQIAADAARTNAIIGAVGTLSAVIAAGIAAWVTYRNAKQTVLEERRKDEIITTATGANLRATIRNKIKSVDDTLATYRGNFSEPVEVRVLTLPEIEGDPAKFSAFGPEVIEAVVIARLRLDDYRKAKDKIQRDYRNPLDNKPVRLRKRPPDHDFDPVIETTEAYRDALTHLASLLPQ
jgi:hypothetical protein